jgi:Xaa-Pro dipeptidase
MWRVTLTHLSKAGLVRGDLEAMLEANVGYIFTPHGLGHLIGIDTHDVGGYLPHTPKRSDVNGLKRLRTARVLEAGMVLTVEPGCYFIDALLEPALAEGSAYRQYLVPEVIARFRGFGGVRLEDVVLVTETGVDNLTLCPRTVSEVEAVRRGAEWPPSADAAPWLHRRWHTLDKKTGRMVVDTRVRVETEPTFTTETDF